MRVGLVGTGVMGHPMGEQLLAAGHSLTVYNRTPDKAASLIDKGAMAAATPADVAANADVVLSSVTDPAAVEQVSLAPNGILAALPSGAVHCDLSTVTPVSAQRIADTYAAHKRMFVQAPVMGSRKQILAGTLVVIAGGDDNAIEACIPVWKAFCGHIWRMPNASHAAGAKLACNLLIAHMAVGLGQSLLLAQKAGVDPALFLDILDTTNLAAPMYRSKGNTLLARDFRANFYVRNMLKDLDLVEDAGKELGAPLPVHGIVRELFVAAAAQGHADEDYSAVVKVLESLAGTALGTQPSDTDATGSKSQA